MHSSQYLWSVFGTSSDVVILIFFKIGEELNFENFKILSERNKAKARTKGQTLIFFARPRLKSLLFTRYDASNTHMVAVFAYLSAIMQRFLHEESTLTANCCLILCLLPTQLQRTYDVWKEASHQ